MNNLTYEDGFNARRPEIESLRKQLTEAEENNRELDSISPTEQDAIMLAEQVESLSFKVAELTTQLEAAKGQGEPVAENGNWTYGKSTVREEWYLESSDFTHDVRLYINGDFADEHDKISYAAEICNRLNATNPAPSAEKVSQDPVGKFVDTGETEKIVWIRKPQVPEGGEVLIYTSEHPNHDAGVHHILSILDDYSESLDIVGEDDYQTGRSRACLDLRAKITKLLESATSTETEKVSQEPESTYRKFWQKYALGSLAATSCMKCGKIGERHITHAELSDIYICKDCCSAPPSTALSVELAIMKCAEVVKELAGNYSGVSIQLNPDDVIHEIKSLLPSPPSLEQHDKELAMRVANKVANAYCEVPQAINICDLRAIVDEVLREGK